MTKHIQVWIQMLSPDEGGRRSPVFLGAASGGRGYCPHVRICGGDGEYLGVEFLDGGEEPLHPGDSRDATAKLMYEPRVDYSSLTINSEFEIIEGGKIVGVGRVTGV